MIVTDENGKKWKMTPAKTPYEELKEPCDRVNDVEKYIIADSPWDIRYGEDYFYYEVGGAVEIDTFDSSVDEEYRNMGNAFVTPEQAEKERDKIQALQRIKKYIWEKGFEFEPDWGDSSEGNWEILYSSNSKEFFTHPSAINMSCVLVPYLGEDEHAQDVIDNCEADLRIIFQIN